MEMYTIKEVAEILKVTEGTVRNYLSDGKIKHIKNIRQYKSNQRRIR